MKKLLFILLTLISIQTFSQDTTYVKVRGIPGITKAQLDSTANLKLAITDTTNKWLPITYKDTINVDKYLNFDSTTKTLKAVVSNDPNAIGDSSKLITDWAAKQMRDSSYISPNMFRGQGLNDVEKIQRALNLSIIIGKPLVIGFNAERSNNLWLLDSAILLKSNSNITIQNAIIKLSDSARDNIFRTENCGIGITNPQDNPLSNISITGLAGAIIQGADNPRSTGDAGKDLSLTTSWSNNTSYGTDAGKIGRSQKGGIWNVGILITYTNNIEISGLTFINMPEVAMSFERCSKGIIRNIHYDCPEKRIINGATQYIKNNAGVDLRLGNHDFTVRDLFGTTGDDGVALTLFAKGTFTTFPGDSIGYEITGNVYDSLTDDIYNVDIDNINIATYANIVRILNTNGTRVHNININNITDINNPDSLYRIPSGAGVVFGSNAPVYGGPTPLGSTKNVTVNQVKVKTNRYAINIQGSLSESTINNVIKDSLIYVSSVPIPPIYFASTSDGARNVLVSNVYGKGIGTLKSVALSGLGIKQGLWIDTTGVMSILDTTGNSINLVGKSSLSTVHVHTATSSSSESAGLLLQSRGFIGYDGSLAAFKYATNVASTSIIFANSLTSGNPGYARIYNSHLLWGYTSNASDDGINQIQVNGSIKTSQYRLSSLNAAPSSSTDTGIAGEIRVTAGYIYVCTATNTWVRAALSTW